LHPSAGARSDSELAQQRVKHIAARVDVLVGETESQIPAVGEFRLVVHQIDQRLLEFEMEMERREDGRRRVHGFALEVVSERHAVTQCDGQDFMLDITTQRDKANCRLDCGRECLCEINGPLFFIVTKYELASLIQSAEDDNQGPKHVLAPWRVLVSFEEVAFSYESVSLKRQRCPLIRALTIDIQLVRLHAHRREAPSKQCL
jgi:hypothetical protein